MRLAAAALVLMLTAAPALAADTEGTIKAVDTEKMTITLDDGQTYKLPAEMDLTGLEAGMDVVIAYRDVKGGQRQITDMVLPDQEEEDQGDQDSN